MRRRGIGGNVLDGCLPHHYRVKREVRTEAMVSIIIPTIAAKGLIKGRDYVDSREDRLSQLRDHLHRRHSRE